MSTPRRGFWLLLAGLLLAAGGFVSLGVWQVHRLAWKLDLIARIDGRIHAAAIGAPGPAVNAPREAYRHVRIAGVFLNDRETLVQAVTALGGGYWVMTPLRTDRGFTVLVNRGFVSPETAHDPAARAVSGRVEVTGLLRVSEPKGGFLRNNDPAGDRWYSRDVVAIARFRHLSDVVPYFIDADRSPDGGGGEPVGGLTVVDLPNNHFVYALTWFGMALLATGAAGFVAFDAWKDRLRPAEWSFVAGWRVR